MTNPSHIHQYLDALSILDVASDLLIEDLEFPPTKNNSLTLTKLSLPGIFQDRMLSLNIAVKNMKMSNSN